MRQTERMRLGQIPLPQIPAPDPSAHPHAGAQHLRGEPSADRGTGEAFSVALSVGGKGLPKQSTHPLLRVS